MDPYFLGSIVNFIYSPLSRDFHDFFIVENTYCSTRQILQTYESYSKMATHPLDRINYQGSEVSFKCHLKQTISRISFCPYEVQEDVWKYVAGIVDMSSILISATNKLELGIYSYSDEFLSQLQNILQIDGIEMVLTTTESPGCLLLKNSQVINLFGKIPMSVKSNEFNIALQGKSILPQCAFRKKDPKAILPYKTQLSDVGFCLYLTQRTRILNENSYVYDTGLVLRMPHKYFAQILALPDLVKAGYILSEGVQIVEPSSTGTLQIALTKVSNYAEVLENKLPFCACRIIFHRQVYIQVVEDETIPLE